MNSQIVFVKLKLWEIACNSISKSSLQKEEKTEKKTYKSSKELLLLEEGGRK